MNDYTGWIPITERLPEEGDIEILALIKSKNFDIAIPNVVTYKGSIWYTTASNPIEDYLDAKVTHWSEYIK